MPFSPPPSQLVLLLYYWTVLTCILALYYCIVLCICIYPSVYSEYRFHSSPHPYVCLCYFSCRKDALFCVLPLYSITCILTLTFLVDNLSASTIVEGSRPCPHPYKYLLSWGKLVFASYCWLIVGRLWCSLCSSLILFPVSKLFSHLLFYLALQLNYYRYISSPHPPVCLRLYFSCRTDDLFCIAMVYY